MKFRLKNILLYVAVIALVIGTVVLEVRILQKRNVEGLDDQPLNSNTIVGMENAYTNIHCVSPELPAIKLGSRSISCLTDANGDDNSCLRLSDFQVPATVACTGSGRTLNTYLSRDGLLDTNSRSRQLFNTLSQQGYKNITCNKAAFEDPNHWCNKILQALDQRCAGKSQVEKDSDNLCNTSFLNAVNARAEENVVTPTTTSFFSPTDFQTRVRRCQSVDCVRQRGANLQVCRANCSLCGKGTC